MVFSTPGWPGVTPDCRGILLALFLALGMPEVLAQPTGIFIQQAQLERREDHEVLSADIDYRFPEVAIQALNEGIPLGFMIRFSIDRPIFPGFRQTLFEESRHIQLRYLPLAKSYQVADLGTGAVQNFTNIMSVINTLRHLRGWEIKLPKDAQVSGTEASLSFRFDVEALPLPLRIEAYVTSAWRIQTGAYRWPNAP